MKSFGSACADLMVGKDFKPSIVRCFLAIAPSSTPAHCHRSSGELSSKSLYNVPKKRMDLVLL